MTERPLLPRLTAVTPFGSELGRSEFDSVLAVSIGRPGPVTTPPGWAAGVDRDPLPLLTRDELGMRLGERDTPDRELPELDDSPALDPELVEPELPLELDPDDPDEPDEPDEPEEPDDPEELPRGTAWAPATLGAASANETTRLSARRVDLAMVGLPRPHGPLWKTQVQLYCHTTLPVNTLVSSELSLICPVALPSCEDGTTMQKVSPAHATTVLAVRHQGKVVMASDGQVTLGQTVVKHQAKKVRRLYHDRVLAGFAGSAADGFALYSRFESKLEEHRGNLERAAVELARDWRTDRILRRLEAMLLVADTRAMYLLSGTGDLIEPDDGVMGIGSGGAFAMAAARALVKHSSLEARAITEQAMAIAAEICVYTNARLVVEELA